MVQRTPGRPITRCAWVRPAVAACVLALAGCGLTKPSDDAPATPPPKASPVGAHLRPIGSHNSAQGSVRFVVRGSGVAMLVSLTGLLPGQYRVMVHANGNCSSPNGFSAGPPWAGAPGVPMLDRVPLLNADAAGSGNVTVRLNGVTLAEGPDGLLGRSVILHDGATGPLTTEPDAPNQRLACGVIGPLETLF